MAPLFILVLSTLLNESRALLNSSPMLPGAEFHKDLLMGEVVCRSLSVPTSSNRIHVEASVVGLTGNPNIFGGWEERGLIDRVQTELAPSNAGGYHILSEFLDVPPDRDAYYVCVTTFSTQGSDFLLTANIRDTGSWYVPPVTLIDSFPAVWRLEEDGHDYADFLFNLPDSVHGNLSVAVTPYSGEVNVQIADCASWFESLAVSDLMGPDVVSLELPEGLSRVCIRVHGTGASEFSIVASTSPDGPFLAQSIGIAGNAMSHTRFRTFFNPGTDLTVIGRYLVLGSDDSPPLRIAAHPEPVAPYSSEWKSDEHSRIEIPRTSLTGQADDVLYIDVASDAPSNQVYVMSLTSHGTVEQLEDGVPIEISVDSNTDNRFNDFRVWIPPGASTVTIQGDSSEDGSGLGIFASTIRTSHDPRGYKWNTMTGTNEIVLSRDFATAGNNFLECDSCYLYISVKSCVVMNGACKDSGLSQYKLVVTTDNAPLQAVPGSFFRLAVTRGIPRPVLLPHDLKGDITIYISGVTGKIRSSIVTDPTSSESSANACDTSPSEPFCRLVVSSDDAIRESSRLYVLVSSLDDAIAVSQADIAVSSDGSPVYLKNHHEVAGWVDKDHTDQFQLFIPLSEGTDSLIEFTSSETAQLTICHVADADCQSASSANPVVQHLKKAGLVSVKISAETRADYRITPSFFSQVANSLRVGYKPVTVSVPGASKSYWEIGYDPKDEWMVDASIQTPSSEVSLCIPPTDGSDSTVRCCALPCALQGFGRQQVWIENKQAADPAIVTIKTEGLAVLQEGTQTPLEGRRTDVFKLPTWPSRVLTDASLVQYMIGSPEGSLLDSAPLDGDVGKGQSVFAKIAGGTKASLQVRHELYLNHWADNVQWSRYLLAEPVPDGRIRVEKCNLDASITVNRDIMGGNSQEFPVIVGDIPQEIFIDGAQSSFRIGLVSGTVVPISVTSYGDSRIVSFRGPKNSAASMYRALCLDGDQSAASQCQLEHSPRTFHSVPVACDPNAYCEIVLPSACGEKSFVSVVPDKGPEYGIFEPVYLPEALAQSGSIDLDDSPVGTSQVSWTWRFFQLIIIYALWRLIEANKILIRIWMFRVIDLLRSRPKSSLLEEMMESGSSYQQFKEVRPSPRMHVAPQSRVYGTEMMNRSLAGSYYGG